MVHLANYNICQVVSSRDDSDVVEPLKWAVLEWTQLNELKFISNPSQTKKQAETLKESLFSSKQKHPYFVSIL